MKTNQTAPVTDEELDQMIWKLERDGGMAPKQLSLMRELREVRRANGEPVSAITPHFDTIALETATEIMCDVNRRNEFLGGDVQLLSRIQCRIDDACRAAMLQGAEPVTTAYKFPEETGSLLQLRNIIRQRHAEWSQATFGDVGPVGPLKHLSKEALEAAAEPEDLSEWADMQFLLWDAQRRAGVSDGEITAAMEEKLKVNVARQWPEPKDGEPRLHIKAAPQQEVMK